MDFFLLPFLKHAALCLCGFEFLLITGILFIKWCPINYFGWRFSNGAAIFRAGWNQTYFFPWNLRKVGDWMWVCHVSWWL